MIDEKSICPRIETGYAYTTDMNDEIVKNLRKVILHKGMLF